MLDGASEAVKKALADALKKKRYVDEYAKASRALGALLAKDDAAREQLHASSTTSSMRTRITPRGQRSSRRWRSAIRA